MRFVKELIFRELTDADFFNINKPPGIEDRGGGQSYIDINTSMVSVRNWYSFLNGIKPEHRTNGPRWNVLIRSLRVLERPPQLITIAQRRSANISIRSQKIRSEQSNRVYAWRPDLTGFPDSPSPAERVPIKYLRIYIAKLDDGEYWAGWFQSENPKKGWYVDEDLRKMYVYPEGYIDFNKNIIFNIDNYEWPFEEYLEPNIFDTPIEKEESYERVYFDEDELIDNKADKVSLQKIRQRNSKAVKKLKILYKNCCQITGKQYTFIKKDGSLYSEAHHLIPLGEGGSDSVHNIIIVSPLIHRMLHYADVRGINLNNIKDNELNITININSYTIKWHPDHGKIVEDSL